MSIKVQTLSVGYEGKDVLKDISLTFPDEGVFALRGPSGVGKTTLLRALAGLIPWQSGTVEGIAGKKISMVFQEDRLLSWRNALENVLLVLPEGEKASLDAAKQWLTNMELSKEMYHYPAALSGGMRRRVSLARACAYGGDILLLDEPFQGLDKALYERICEHMKKAAPLIIMVTHDEGEAAAMGAKTIHLKW